LSGTLVSYQIQKGAASQQLPPSFVSDGEGEFPRVPWLHLKAGNPFRDMLAFCRDRLDHKSRLLWGGKTREALASVRVRPRLTDAGHSQGSVAPFTEQEVKSNPGECHMMEGTRDLNEKTRTARPPRRGTAAKQTTSKED
jgi:hypothetical protein